MINLNQETKGEARILLLLLIVIFLNIFFETGYIIIPQNQHFNSHFRGIIKAILI